MRLDAELLAALRRRYTGCLCVACLQALATAPEPLPTDNGHAARE